MNSEYKDETPPMTGAEAIASPPLNINTEPGALSKVTPATTEPAVEEQWQQLREQLYWLLTVLPERLTETYAEYKQPLTLLGAVLTVIPVVALAVAVLKVINAIPLFAPTFELVGFSYTAWFLYRYLLFADRRQEFANEIQTLTDRILGPKE